MRDCANTINAESYSIPLKEMEHSPEGKKQQECGQEQSLRCRCVPNEHRNQFPDTNRQYNTHNYLQLNSNYWQRKYYFGVSERVREREITTIKAFGV